MVTLEGPEGWIAFHPALIPYSRAFYGYVREANGGIDVATSTAGWLEEMGAEQIEVHFNQMAVSGKTKAGSDILRNNLKVIRNSGPMLIKLGRFSQAEFDTMMEIVMREVGVNSSGQGTVIDVLARKPR
jgi:hypothetical protein